MSQSSEKSIFKSEMDLKKKNSTNENVIQKSEDMITIDLSKPENADLVCKPCFVQLYDCNGNNVNIINAPSERRNTLQSVCLEKAHASFTDQTKAAVSSNSKDDSKGKMSIKIAEPNNMQELSIQISEPNNVKEVFTPENPEFFSHSCVPLIGSKESPVCTSVVDAAQKEEKSSHIQAKKTMSTAVGKIESSEKGIFKSEVDLQSESSDCCVIGAEQKKDRNLKSTKNDLQNVNPDEKCSKSVGAKRKLKCNSVKQKRKSKGIAWVSKRKSKSNTDKNKNVIQKSDDMNTVDLSNPENADLVCIPCSVRLSDCNRNNVNIINTPSKRRNTLQSVCLEKAHASFTDQTKAAVSSNSKESSKGKKSIQISEPSINMKDIATPENPESINHSCVHLIGRKEIPVYASVVDAAQKEKLSHIQAKKTMSTTVGKIEKHIDHLSMSSSMNDAFNQEKTWMCVFCHKGSHHEGLGDLFGPYFIQDKNSENLKKVDPYEKRSERTKTDSSEEVWIHEDCAIWSPRIYSFGQKLIGLEEAVSEARESICCHCSLNGATVGCMGRRCKVQYHFSCIRETDCELDFENFSMLCAEHKENSASERSWGH